MKKTLVIGVATAALCMSAAPALASDPTVINHQGVGSASVSKNSIQAFIKGWRATGWIETDIRLTLETPTEKSRIIVSHNANIATETNAPWPTIVEETPWSVIRQYHLEDGSRVATLERVIRAADRHGDGGALLETKGLGWTKAKFHYIQKLAVQHGLVKKIRPYIARQRDIFVARQVGAAARLKLVWKLSDADPGLPSTETLNKLDIFGLSVRWGSITHHSVRRVHNAGWHFYGKLAGHTWKWRKACDFNIDGFLSNNGPKARDWMERNC